MLASLIDAAQRDPELAWLHADFIPQRAATIVTVLTRGVVACQRPPDVAIELMVAMLAGPVDYRRLISHGPDVAGIAPDVVDRTIAAFETPGAT